LVRKEGGKESLIDKLGEKSEKLGTYLIDTNIMAKMRYFPSRGTTKLVGGMISTTSKKNTWRLMRIEIAKVTYTGKRHILTSRQQYLDSQSSTMTQTHTDTHTLFSIQSL